VSVYCTDSFPFADSFPFVDTCPFTVSCSFAGLFPLTDSLLIYFHFPARFRSQISAQCSFTDLCSFTDSFPFTELFVLVD
jgi:hypothetical protein